jgi:hypothetical protein
MAAAVYILGILVALACGVLLLRGYLRGRQKLLLWSSLCCLAASNLLVFLDLVMFPNKDLYVWRLTTAAVAMMFLLYGLIWEGE